MLITPAYYGISSVGGIIDHPSQLSLASSVAEPKDRKNKAWFDDSLSLQPEAPGRTMTTMHSAGPPFWATGTAKERERRLTVQLVFLS
jgi:hypothetical protein